MKNARNYSTKDPFIWNKGSELYSDREQNNGTWQSTFCLRCCYKGQEEC